MEDSYMFIPTKYEAENLILDLADSICELRRLRKEVEELREYKEKYEKEVYERFKDSQKMSAAIFQGILDGVISKPNNLYVLLKNLF